MADNEFVAGQAQTYVQWVWTGGTVSMYVDARNFSYNPSIDMIDRTAGYDTTRKFTKSFKGGQAALETLAQTDGTVLLSACAEGNYGTLTWGPAGTASGRPKRYMAAYAMGVSESYPYADVAVWNVSFQQDGDRTDGTW